MGIFGGALAGGAIGAGAGAILGAAAAAGTAVGGSLAAGGAFAGSAAVVGGAAVAGGVAVGIGAVAGVVSGLVAFKPHTSNKRKSNWDKHSGRRSGAPEKKDSRMKYKKPKRKSKGFLPLVFSIWEIFENLLDWE